MIDYTWTYPIIRTWLHILAGLAVLATGYFVLGAFVSWVRSIERQYSLMRKLQNRAPDEWGKS